eukprot:gene37423-48947_t
MSLNIYDFEQLAAADISVMTMRRRRRLLLKEMAAVTLVSGHEWKLEELQGRISGDKNWKIARVNAMDTVPWMLPGLQTSTSALSKGYIDIVTCSMGSNDNIDTCGNITSLHGSTSTSTSTPMQRF